MDNQYTINEIVQLLQIELPGEVLLRLIDFANQHIEDPDVDDWQTVLSEMGYLVDDSSFRISEWLFSAGTLSDILA